MNYWLIFWGTSVILSILLHYLTYMSIEKSAVISFITAIIVVILLGLLEGHNKINKNENN